MNQPLEMALRFAGMGWKLFPQDRNKHPCIKNWPNQATDDPDQLRDWAKKFPKANFAVVTGQHSGIIVLDVDVKNDLPGNESFLKLEKQFGKLPGMRSRTPSGGGHVFFIYPRGNGKIKNCELKKYPGIEIKADGGCITLPGSFYADGREYKLISNNGVPARCPEGLLKLLISQKDNKQQIAPDKTVQAGGRNNRLTALAGSMRRQGADSETIIAALIAENENHCSPPLGEKEVKEIAQSVSRYSPGAGVFHKTDTGNAERLVSRYGFEIRYCDEWAKWLIWDGKRWAKDSMRMIRRFAKNTVRGMYIEGSQIEVETERKTLVKYALGCEAMPRIRNMIEAATSEPGIPVRTEDLDQNTMLLNVENGTIDLTTGELQPHKQTNLITKLCPVGLDMDAECPRWASFLNQIMATDQDVIFFLQKAIGLSLTGDVSEDVFFFLHGGGENGKTTFLNTVHSLLGDYSCRSQIETFLSSRNDAIPNDLAALQGARFVSAVEAKKGRRFDEGRLKMLTGGDPIQARFMRAEYFEFMPQLKIWIAGNNKPVITDTTRGMWRRVRLIPFNVQIPEDKQDKHLEEKLKEELPGILLWALAGCLAWQQEGLGYPDAVKEATEEYRQEMDVLGDFISEKLVKDKAAKIQSSILYEQYLGYCENVGEKRPWTLTKLVLEMKERGFEKQRAGGAMFWIGIGLR